MVKLVINNTVNLKNETAMKFNDEVKEFNNKAEAQKYVDDIIALFKNRVKGDFGMNSVKSGNWKTENEVLDITLDLRFNDESEILYNFNIKNI